MAKETLAVGGPDPDPSPNNYRGSGEPAGPYDRSDEDYDGRGPPPGHFAPNYPGQFHPPPKHHQPPTDRLNPLSLINTYKYFQL